MLHVGGVEAPLVEVAVDFDCREVRIGDELGERGIAADVALALGVERFGIDLPDHVSQVEIALP